MLAQPPLFGRPAHAAEHGLNSPSAAESAAFNPSADQIARATRSAVMDGGSRLVVGANIKLKGDQITDCDTLVIEGVVEAKLKARVMQIAEHGAFKGTADMELVEIRGRFDGALIVHQTLAIQSTGSVAGKIQYQRLVVEEGGQLAGEINCPGSEPIAPIS
jgi:cytoskeletal protein CcmA (bactofilin family)